jgi:VWFA-related protein
MPVYATAIVLVLTCAVNGQQTPVFRAGVELVTLDVRVLDSEGRPVTGLTPDDFVIELDGKKQQVRIVDYFEFAGAKAGSEVVDTTAPGVPGRAAPKELTGRNVLIAIDDLSFRPQMTQTFAATARHLINSLGANDSVEIATTSGQGAMTPLSRDKTRAILSLKELSGRRVELTQDGPAQRVQLGPTTGTEIVMSAAEALAIQSGNDDMFQDVAQRVCGRRIPLASSAGTGACPVMIRTEAAQQAAAIERASTFQIESLREMIDTLREAPPPRILIVMSAGVDTDPDHSSRLDAVHSAAVAAGVQAHVLIPGLTNVSDATDRTALRSQMRRDNDDFSRRGLELVAGNLNADVYRVVGAPDRQVDRVLIGWSGSYRVGVDPPATTRGGQIPVTVTVKRPGLTVKSAKFVLLRTVTASTASAARVTVESPTVTAPSSEERLARLVDDGGTATEVPMAIGVMSKRDEGGRDVQIVTVEVPSGTQAPLSGLFSATDEANRVIQRGTLSFPTPGAGDDYRVSVVVPIAPGAYRIRVAVADAAGAVGSVEHSGAARLSRLRSSTVSDLLLSWVGDDGKGRFVAMEGLPAPARTLQASLEFYSSSDSAGTSVRMALIKEGAAAPVAETTAVPMKTQSGWRLGVSVPLATLEPGAYTVRATITEGSDPPLVLSRTVRKVAPPSAK